MTINSFLRYSNVELTPHKANPRVNLMRGINTGRFCIKGRGCAGRFLLFLSLLPHASGKVTLSSSIVIPPQCCIHSAPDQMSKCLLTKPFRSQAQTRCMQAKENVPLSLDCGASAKIVSVDHAVFGSPRFTGGESCKYVNSSCAAYVAPVIAHSCVGQSLCTFANGVSSYGKDPCPNFGKHTIVVYSCQGDVLLPSEPPPPTAPPSPLRLPPHPGVSPHSVMAFLDAEIRERYRVALETPGASEHFSAHRWANTYKVNSTHFMHVGWARRNSTDVDLQRGNHWTGHESPWIYGVWDDTPECCVPSWTAQYFDGRAVIDGLRMSLCSGNCSASYLTPLPGLKDVTRSPIPKRRRVTLCTSVIRGTLENMHIAWLGDYMRYYNETLGVEHFFLYVSGLPFQHFPGLSYDWIDVTWIQKFNDWSYGQFWVEQDCLAINQEQENGWAIFVDPDELVAVPGPPLGLVALADALEAAHLGAASFPSVPYTVDVCAPPRGDGAPPAVSPAVAERFVYRTVNAEGCNHRFYHRCFGDPAGGRRKPFAKVDFTALMGIHGIDKLRVQSKHDFPHRTFYLNATRAFIKHVRSVAYRWARYGVCTRKACRLSNATTDDEEAFVCPDDSDLKQLTSDGRVVRDSQYIEFAESFGTLLVGELFEERMSRVEECLHGGCLEAGGF